MKNRIIKQCALLIAVMSVALGHATAEDAVPVKGPVKVYILLGQSNMLGFGKVSPEATRGTLENAVKVEKQYPNLIDKDGNWVVRKDVRYVHVMQHKKTFRTLRNEWMTVGSAHVGPELGIGHALGDYHDETVLVLKACIGNRSLGWDYLPPGSERFECRGKIHAGYRDVTGAWTRSETPNTNWLSGAWYAGKQYDDDVSYAKAVLADLDTYCPGATDYEIAGFFWWQGHKDQNKLNAMRYEHNLVNFIKALRKDFDAPEAPFGCATVAFGGRRMAGDTLTILKAQLAVSGETGTYPEFEGNVVSVDTRPFWQPSRRSPGGGGHHYNGNARTYMDVGNALGHAMVELHKGTAPASVPPKAGARAGLYQSLPEAMHPGLDFLLENMPAADEAALSDAFLAEHIRYAYKVRAELPWAGKLSEDLFLNYVLPYACLDEKREPWRKKLYEDVVPLVAKSTSVSEAVLILNTKMYEHYGVVYSKARPKACQGPLETIKAQKASCTGLSILLVDACRAAGIAANVVGTPLWSDGSGNHTWVEVYDDGWKFLGAAESKTLNNGWFVDKASKQDGSEPQNAIYAASFKKSDAHFPLVWNRGSKAVHALNITPRYAASSARVISIADVEKMLQEQSLSDLRDSEEIKKKTLAVSDLDEVAALVWAAYKRECLADEERKREHNGRAIRVDEKTMRYAYKRVGAKPEQGYPLYIALHGGGGAPKSVNDGQWLHMQKYYLAGVTNGIYLAPRGVTDTWNLHFVQESYLCYDRLIDNMIVFEGVDPNRVHVMGYSAGGDGVYQIGARMADRWAAAAMSAGHHNGVSAVNYANLPLLIQLGAKDHAYKRNTAAAEYGNTLTALREGEPSLYVHDVFLHVGRGHGFMDRDPRGSPQRVFVDPNEWLTAGDTAKMMPTNTCSIQWLNQYVREPLPERVIWDRSTTTAGNGDLFYWLGGKPFEKDAGKKKQGQATIVARYERKSNTVAFEKVGQSVTLFLNGKMLDLGKPVHVDLPGKRLNAKPVPRLDVLIASLLERGDPNFMFPVRLQLEVNPEGDWIFVGT
ncbi:MAG: hypothetical protein HN383_13010 [Verrucomicrobia bacterium]|jgi:hypothetical protein|nr:hypothetical protein [Verrucomicrobiota bacterium]MBT7700395.1 hypothetical protein [Verrucomicrobiota bacterium]